MVRGGSDVEIECRMTPAVIPAKRALERNVPCRLLHLGNSFTCHARFILCTSLRRRSSSGLLDMRRHKNKNEGLLKIIKVAGLSALHSGYLPSSVGYSSLGDLKYFR